jgi:hypothetical protein
MDRIDYEQQLAAEMVDVEDKRVHSRLTHFLTHQRQNQEPPKRCSLITLIFRMIYMVRPG